MWLAVTRSRKPDRAARVASTSTKRDCSSSISSQCASTREAVPLGEVDRELDRAHAVLAGVLEVGDRADHVDAAAGGLGQQLLAVRERADALLRERHELEVDHVAHPVAYLEQRVERDQRRVGDVDVAADVEGAVRGVPPQRLLGPVDDVLAGEHRLALGPAGDALPERAARVPARLTRGEGRVEVHVRLDVRRGRPGTGAVDDLACLDGRVVGAGTTADDPAAVDVQVDDREPRRCPRRAPGRHGPAGRSRVAPLRACHQAADLVAEGGRCERGDLGVVVGRAHLDQVGGDDLVAREGPHQAQQLARGEAAHLRGAGAGGERRVEHVDVDREVDRVVADAAAYPVGDLGDTEPVDVVGPDDLEAEARVVVEVLRAV